MRVDNCYAPIKVNEEVGDNCWYDDNAHRSLFVENISCCYNPLVVGLWFVVAPTEGPRHCRQRRGKQRSETRG